MKITSARVGKNSFSDQLQIKVQLGLPVEFRVIFYSSSRNTITYEIFDQFDASMGERHFPYGGGMHQSLVGDLNVLLEEFGQQIADIDFLGVVVQAHDICDSRYGMGIAGGDVVVTIN